MKKEKALCRRAILKDGQITGWEEICPTKFKSAQEWAQSKEGKISYEKALQKWIDDGHNPYTLNLVPAKGPGGYYWKYFCE